MLKYYYNTEYATWSSRDIMTAVDGAREIL